MDYTNLANVHSALNKRLSIIIWTGADSWVFTEKQVHMGSTDVAMSGMVDIWNKLKLNIAC